MLKWKQLGMACAQADGFGSGRLGDVRLWVDLAGCCRCKAGLCPQEPRLEAGLPFFRAAPLNELPVPGSTSNSRGGKGCAGQEASPGKQESVHLPESFTTSQLSLFFSTCFFTRAEESARRLCALARPRML